MDRLFDRKIGDGHPWKRALANLWNHSDIENRALARNLAHDHRVSKEREYKLLAYIPSPSNGTELLDGLKSYYQAKVKTRSRPDYVFDHSNGGNFVSGRGIGNVQGITIHRSIELAQVLDLNGLAPVFQAAIDSGRRTPALSGFPGSGANEKDFDQWLDRKLSGTRSRREFVPGALSALARVCEQRPFQPTWVTFWNQLEPYLDEGPDRWLEVLGVHKPFAFSNPRHRWLIVLCYRVKTRKLVRPTVLETNANPFHFPSPPSAAIALGGHPMELADVHHVPLLNEYIHSQIPPRNEYWSKAGSRCEKTEPRATYTFAQLRRSHLGKLGLQYGPRSVQQWWPDPV